jgi:hypothetical protein
MCWGSLNGFYLFNPKDLKQTLAKSNKVTLTDFLFMILKHKSEKRMPLLKNPLHIRKDSTKSFDKVFHIEFANLDFHDPKQISLCLCLKIMKKMEYNRAYNIATYRNVPPGKYIFKSKV